MVPFLPPDTSKADLPYSRYEQIRTYIDQNPTIPELPESCTTEIDTLHKDTLIGYSNYFSFTHPECMAGVDDEVKDAIIGAILQRTFTDYETS
jgi:hypothetical protein